MGMLGDRREQQRWMAWAGPWLLLSAAACKEPNPDFDGAAESANDTGSASTSTTGPEPTTSPDSTGPVVTGDGTTGASSGEPPGTSSGEPPGTSSGEPGSTTEACVGMVCMGVCVDTMTDDDNCGECDNKCVGQQMCIDGTCVM